MQSQTTEPPQPTKSLSAAIKIMFPGNQQLKTPRKVEQGYEQGRSYNLGTTLCVKEADRSLKNIRKIDKQARRDVTTTQNIRPRTKHFIVGTNM